MKIELIERLGGYEDSKGLLNLYEYSISFKYCLDSSGDFESWVYLDVFVPDLKQALLQYRREHNIYEVGDVVVHPNMTYGYLYEIYEIKDILIKVKCLSVGGRKSTSFKSDIRHATDLEIQANKRLEVCGG